MAWLIIQHDEDKYGFTPPATHEHIPDYPKALAKFERLVKVENRRVTLLTDPEYNKLYRPDPVSA